MSLHMQSKNRAALYLILTFICAVAVPQVGHAEVIHLEQYLEQVRKENPAYRASQLAWEGAQIRQLETRIMFTPQINGQVSYHYDRQPAFGPFSYDELGQTAYQVGIAHQTRVGLKHQLTYKLNQTELRGLVSTAIPLSQVTLYEPTLAYDFTLSLSKNVLGLESRAQAKAMSTGALAQGYGERFKGKAALTEAEANYWRLALAREAVKIQTDAVENANKMLSWATRRASLSLGDKSDVYQLQAAFDLRRLQLQSATDEERSARLAFNSLRGLKDDAVDENLIPLTPELIASLKVPARAKFRDDVKAAEMGRQSAEASSVLNKQKYLPVVDFFGNLNLWQRGIVDAATANSDMFTKIKPGYTFGVKVQIPLALGALVKVLKDANKEKEAAEANYSRSLINQERDWTDLTQKLQESRARYELATKIEKIQGEKASYEKSRLSLGRTTTSQVINFEQDYRSSQLTRIQIQAQILSIVAQMKLFEGTAE